jgi:hypothetical protein
MLIKAALTTPRYLAQTQTARPWSPPSAHSILVGKRE